VGEFTVARRRFVIALFKATLLGLEGRLSVLPVRVAGEAAYSPWPRASLKDARFLRIALRMGIGRGTLELVRATVEAYTRQVVRLFFGPVPSSGMRPAMEPLATMVGVAAEMAPACMLRLSARPSYVFVPL
jgi:hypothetical protein